MWPFQVRLPTGPRDALSWRCFEPIRVGRSRHVPLRAEHFQSFGRLSTPRHTSVSSSPVRQCRNVDLLPITYAFRPRLRGRLTLGGRAFPRKPEVFGEADFHHLCRYSCRAYSLPCRPAVLTVDLQPAWNAPLPLGTRRLQARSFGTMLESRSFSARKYSTSELLRTL